MSGASGSPVARAAEVAARVLAPAAARTDRAAAVPAQNLRALAAAGLFGLAAGPDAAASPEEARRVREVLAGACGATYFVWLQHQGPLRMLAGTPNDDLRGRLFEDLRTGRTLAGIAYSHLRRPDPGLAARAVRGGLVVSGSAPWVTSWGMAGVFAVAAVAGDEIVWFCLPGSGAPGVAATPPMRLAVMGAARTVSLTLDRVRVPSRDVLLVEPLAAWRRRDEVHTVEPNPAALGVAAACLGLLRESAARGPAEGRPLIRAARGLAGEIDEHRRLADGLLDRPVPTGAEARRRHLARLAHARADGLDLSLRAARTLVVASGAAGVRRDHPAGRLAREAGFWSVFGQTPSARAALLALGFPGR